MTARVARLRADNAGLRVALRESSAPETVAPAADESEVEA